MCFPDLVDAEAAPGEGMRLAQLFNPLLLGEKRAPVPCDNDPKGNAGLDFKYGLTRSLILDATYRTDFAQVEEDLQQINPV